jgi:hypothetical protein
MFKTFKKYFVYTVFLIVGTVLLYQGYQEKIVDNHLKAEGKQATGSILDLTEHRGRKGRKSYRADISYTPESGAAQTKKFFVSSDFYETHQIQDTVTLLYWPQDPQQSRLEGESSDHFWLLLAGAGLTLAGLGCFAWSLRRLALG